MSIQNDRQPVPVDLTGSISKDISLHFFVEKHVEAMNC